MLHLLYGPDTYRSREKLQEMTSEYQSRYGADIGIQTIDVEEDDAARIKQLTETGSLFAKKRVLVFKRVLSSGESFGEILPLLQRAKGDADTLMILWDSDLGKEGEKRLAQVRPLADSVQECALRPQPEQYDAKARSRMVFEFGDLFMTAPRRALAELPRILASGQEEFSLYSYLVGYCRTLLIIQSYEERREPVLASHKINPFVLRKGKALVQNIPGRELRAMLQNFFVEDYKIKTGVSNPRDSLTRILLTRQRSS
ncbi:MAG: hypothetical protein HY007_04335 [Candidatus Sungbacteria bacterium]|nr:hypothetical protein [Candidatus Sungbacteria bacterium]